MDDTMEDEDDYLISLIKENYNSNASIQIIYDRPKPGHSRDDQELIDFDLEEPSCDILDESITHDSPGDMDLDKDIIENDHNYCSPNKVVSDNSIGNLLVEVPMQDTTTTVNIVHSNLSVESKSGTTCITAALDHDNQNKPEIVVANNTEEQLLAVIETDIEEELLDDPDWLPPDDTNSGVNEGVEELPGEETDVSLGRLKNSRNRKRALDKNQWHDNKNKSLREKGKCYVGWKKEKNKIGKRGPERSERKMGAACMRSSCRKSFRQCQNIDEETRASLFKEFWDKMSWDQKKIYVASLVKKKEKHASRKEPCEKSRRTFTYEYTIKLPNGNVVPVCKPMFLATFGLKEWSVMNWVSSSNSGILPSKEISLSTRQRAQTTGIAKKILTDFLEKMPKLPSHYCRQNTKKVYIEPVGVHNISDIYREYEKLCKNNTEGPVAPLSRFTFDSVIHDLNISFQPPKKDRVLNMR